MSEKHTSKLHLRRGANRDTTRSVCRYTSRPGRRVVLADPQAFAAASLESRCGECTRVFDALRAAIGSATGEKAS